jgi:hypothetical protein
MGDRIAKMLLVIIMIVIRQGSEWKGSIKSESEVVPSSELPLTESIQEYPVPQ